MRRGGQKRVPFQVEQSAGPPASGKSEEDDARRLEATGHVDIEHGGDADGPAGRERRARARAHRQQEVAVPEGREVGAVGGEEAGGRVHAEQLAVERILLHEHVAHQRALREAVRDQVVVQVRLDEADGHVQGHHVFDHFEKKRRAILKASPF